MLSNFADIKWNKIEEAIPAFFATAFMAFCYSISYGIAMGFISYCLIELVLYTKNVICYYSGKKKLSELESINEDGNIINKTNGEIICGKPKLKISVILGVSTLLFLLNFILLATPLMNK